MSGTKPQASPEAIQRSVERMVREAMAKSTPARVDADRKAKPKTRLVGHARQGDCVGPGTVAPDAIEDTATGVRTKLDD